MENIAQTFLEALNQNWVDSALCLGLIFFMILGALRGFGRTCVYCLIFFASTLFALWWFAPYLRTFTVENVPALLVNIFYFWAGNTMISWMATKVVMALDRNGVGAISRVGGAVMGAVYAIGLLIVANVSYALALPESDRLDPLPETFQSSSTLQKADATATYIYSFMEKSGVLDLLTSHELKKDGDSDSESTLTDE